MSGNPIPYHVLMYKTYKINEVLPHVRRGTVTLDNHVFRVGRFFLFAKKGIKCVDCHLKASFFAVESSNGVFNLNLYGVDKFNKPVLFTRDHIIPLSRGGSGDITNLQPMCATCNNKKGDKISFRDRVIQTGLAIARFQHKILSTFRNTFLLLKAIWRK